MSNNKKSIAPPLFIDQQHPFEELVKDLKTEPVLAIDTEANSLYAYKEQVCLIQISSKEQDFIIDPLALEDLAPLGRIFSDPQIEKIFHASEYDILILHEDFDFRFTNLFDTMLAAQILGRNKLGLDALLKEFIGIQVNKKYQRSDWGKRPLPNDMLQYAQIDTHYLIEIRDRLAAELETANLTSIAREDFTRACLAYKHIKEEEESALCWKINGSRKLPPQQAAVLNQLCEYREQVARKIDRPVFKVIGANTLFKLAENSPTTKNQLLKLDIPGKKNIERHSEGLLAAIQRGLDSKPLHPPRRERVDESYLARESALRNWRKLTARKMKVNSAVVMPRDLLYKTIAENPRNKSELGRVLEDVPWRMQKFGDDILSVINKANHTGRQK
jgi:ribonuclease D